ncbi:MAG: filamentous hemagglutinin family protein [Burkholderiales bacterium]
MNASSVALSAPKINIGSSGNLNDPLAVQVAAPTRNGAATLDLRAGDMGITPPAGAGIMDLFGRTTLNGFRQVSLRSAGDVRLTGKAVDENLQDGIVQATRLVGSLTTTASLLIEADRLYPTSLSEFSIAIKQVSGSGAADTIVPGGVLTIRGTGVSARPISSGGKLSLAADLIDQGGSLMAPLGQVSLAAGSRLQLTQDSLIDVSGAGLIVPFGRTVNGLSWNYNGIDLRTPPDKRVSLSGTQIDIEAGSVINVSAGGEIQAAEFVPGPGGSTDTLLGANKYAILPWLKDEFGPYDSGLSAMKDLQLGTDRNAYDAVYLTGGAGLDAGVYALLPGYYALLPGAYIVEALPTAQFRDLAPGRTSRLADGASVLAGYRAVAGTAIRESRTSGFSVRPGTDAAKASEYRLSNSQFFADLAKAADRVAPRLPQDAGRLAIAASGALDFRGILAGDVATGGIGPQVDITSERIAVVARKGQAGVPDGFVEIEAGTLSALNASLMLGGIRSDSDAGTAVAVGASQIVVQNDAANPFTGPEVILAATDSISVESGAVIRAEGRAAVAGDLLISGNGTSADGALLRVANGAQVNVLRQNPTRSKGGLSIHSGALLAAAGSILLDATRSNSSAGTLDIAQGGAVSLGAGRIQIGGDGTTGDVLRIDNAQILAFANLGSLRLRSYSSLDLAGDVTLGGDALQELVIDTGTLSGLSVAGTSGNATLRARSIRLQNSGEVSAGDGNGLGRLDILGDRVVLGAGNKRVNGFAKVAITGREDILIDGAGDLQFRSDVDLIAPRIGATSGARQNIFAGDSETGYRTLVTQRTQAPSGNAFRGGLGAKLTFTAGSITHGGVIDLAGGTVNMTSRNAGGNVTLANGSQINLAGRKEVFAQASAYAPAGNLVLDSSGEVTMGALASIDLSGDAEGGDAGLLQIAAREGGVQLNGLIAASASTGRRQARFILDVNTLDNFSALNAVLNQGGVSEMRDIRVRNGNLTIAESDRVVARNLKLSTDAGAISLLGVIDGSGPAGGGRVELSARRADGAAAVILADGSLIDARGTSVLTGETDAYSHGGSVSIVASGGDLQFMQGAQIDVSADPQGKSNGGTVRLVADRNAAGTSIAASLSGEIHTDGFRRTGSAGELIASGRDGLVVVEGARAYDGVTDVSAAMAAGGTVHSEFQSFMGNAAAIRSAQGLTGLNPSQIQIRAGIGLDNSNSAVDMILSAQLDLSQSQWMEQGMPGRLSLRSARNLLVNAALGLGSDNAVSAASWDLRLVGGADFSAADTRRTLASPDAGDVVLGTAASRVRSSTGNIEVSAGRDFRIGHSSAAVLSTGITNVSDRFTNHGGDISIEAGRDVLGTANQQWVNDWLRRTTLPALGNVQTLRGRTGEWWVHRTNFRQNVGSFGGGDIEIHAGANIASLSAMNPSSGRVFKDLSGADQLEVNTGGNLTVVAGNNVTGGEFMLGNGRGRMEASGSLGTPAARPTLFVMGEHHDAALRGAHFSLAAREDVFLQTVANPTMLVLSTVPGSPSTTTPGFGSARSAFFTYAPDSEVSLESLNGDIDLGSRVPSKNNLSTEWSGVFTPRLAAVALDGKVLTAPNNQERIALYSSVLGRMRVLAEQGIENLWIEAIDVRPDRLPNWRSVEAASGVQAAPGESVLLAVAGNSLPRIVTPDADPATPYVVSARSGDLRDLQLFLPKESSLEAGRDIVNLQLTAQNLGDSDLTRVAAGRNIRYTGINAAGVRSDNGGITISGAGGLLVRAAGNIELGATQGIIARGDADNASLPGPESAHVIVAAGVRKDLDAADTNALFAELLAAGQDNDLERGNGAVDALFPASVLSEGNLSMIFSKIKTEGGSGIDIVVPRGDINAGITSTQAREIGIVTTLGGAVRTYLSGDFNINQSKVMTLQGGDIIAYTREGSIDAGRGARDSRTTQPPRRTKDDTGLTVFIPPQDASGAGIRTLTSDADGAGPLAAPRAGDVYLFAPRGVIDAGEAGIASGGNIVLVALQVLNATNISAGGSSVGVPQTSGTTLAASLSGSTAAASAATKSAEEATRDAATDKANEGSLQTAFRPSFLTVELLGIGEAKQGKEDKK